MNHSPAPALPRLLLVEDDLVNAAFLAGASAALPAEVVQAGSLAEAEAACRDADFDLFLLDANLPDGRGEDLLRSLRGAGITSVALAHTADVDDALHTRLLAAGFVAVLRKPLSVATLHAALRRWLPAAETPRPCWDDAAALAALQGSGELVAADIENGPWPLPGRRFDAVVVTHYLWRPLWPALLDSLAPGGVLLYETFAAGNETVGRPARPDFLLKPGELLDVVRGRLRVVAYEDGFLDAPERFVQRIAAVFEASANGAPARYPLQD